MGGYGSPSRIVEQWSSTAQRTHDGIDGTLIDIGSYHTNDDRSPGARARILVDDVYLDRTWARVELGDAASFEDCTRREVQLVTSWTDTAIEIVLSQGAFERLSGLFLHVIDETGSVVVTEPL